MFRQSDECYELGLRAGAVVFRGVRVESSSPELREEVNAEVGRIRKRFERPADVRALPEVCQYADTLRSLGVKPRSHPPSVESLLCFALKRSALPVINSFVDAYNLISVRSLISMGAHDLDRIASPVELRFFRGTETFTPLGSREVRSVSAEEFGYVDAANRVLCRLDVLQADFSKVTPAATNVLLIIEGTRLHGEDALRRAFDDAVEMIRRHCSGDPEIVAFPKF